jgi:hypothetical protein
MLVGDEGREATARRALIPFLGRLLGLLPGSDGRVAATTPVLAADRGRAQAVDPLDEILGAFLYARYDEGPAIAHTDLARVDGGLRIGAEADPAVAVGVIRYRGEVEGAAELEGPGASPALVERRKQRLAAAREAIGVVGTLSGIEDPGVHRDAGMDVEVAPVDVALGVVVAAAIVGRVRCRRRPRRGRQSESERHAAEEKGDQENGTVGLRHGRKASRFSRRATPIVRLG